MSLQDIRKQYPQYDDMSDGELAYRMWANNYSDMPMGQFADKVDLSKREFAEMVVSARQSGYAPTARGQAAKRVHTDIGATGIPRSIVQGMTFGGADEIVAGLTAGARKLGGDERKIGDIYQQEVEAERGRLEQYRETDPVKAGVAEMAGAMAVPLGAAKGVKSAAGIGAGTGAVTGALSAEEDRLEAAGYGALFGGLLGPMFYKGGELASTQFGKLFKDRARKAASEGAPALEQLKREASQAYKVAREKGAVISADAYEQFVRKAITEATDGVPLEKGLLPKTEKVLGAIQRKVGQEVGIESLDNLRKLAQIPAGEVTNKAEQRAAIKIIGAIDSFVEELTPEQLTAGAAEGVGEAFKTARSLWGKMRKTEQLEEILEKSKHYAGGLESGIKNQINSILRNKKKQRGFTEAELDLMREISEGTPIGNLVGNLSQMGLSATGGRSLISTSSGMAAGAGTGFLVGGPAGAAAGAVLELAGTTALRYVRELSLENQVKLMRDLVASGQVQKFAQQAPEAFQALQVAAQKAGQGAIITTVPEMQRTPQRGLLAE